MSKITAAEARNIAGPTVQEVVDAVYPLIKEQAELKRRKLHLHDDFWTHGGYNRTKEWKEAVSLLEADGYKVSFYYMELQFVDLYTVVEW